MVNNYTKRNTSTLYDVPDESWWSGVIDNFQKPGSNLTTSLLIEHHQSQKLKPHCVWFGVTSVILSISVDTVLREENGNEKKILLLWQFKERRK